MITTYKMCIRAMDMFMPVSFLCKLLLEDWPFCYYYGDLIVHLTVVHVNFHEFDTLLRANFIVLVPS